MKIKQERQEDILCLKLSGRLEISTAPELQQVIESIEEKVKTLRIDMEEIEYVSSAGLRVLLAAAKKMDAREGVMTLYHVNQDVMEVFEITGFKEILDIQ